MSWELSLKPATRGTTGARVIVLAIDEEQGLADVMDRERIVYAASDPPPPITRERIPLTEIGFDERRA
jgi:hypothetical protein